MSLAVVGISGSMPPNQRLHPTALRAHKSAASRAFSELSSKVTHAESARRLNPDRWAALYERREY